MRKAGKCDTGEPLLPEDAAPAMLGLHHFQTLIATRDRLYAGTDSRIHAFAFWEAVCSRLDERARRVFAAA
jgi:hypothetical protein